MSVLIRFLDPTSLITIAGSGVLLIGGLVVSATFGVRRWRARLMVHGAHEITVTAPPEIGPADAPALWDNLMGILRPAWRRAIWGQPHLVWEYRFSRDGIGIHIWIPGPIPPALIARAIEAAWPGAATTITDAEPPLPVEAVGIGGQLALARPDDYPLRSDHDADPVRALLGATNHLAADEHACVQILARPATGRRLRHARATAATLRAGGSTRTGSLSATLLDTVAPARRGHPRAATDPVLNAETRAIVDKAGHPRYACTIRYAVATTRPGRDREHLRGRAHAIAAWSAVYAGRNHLNRRQLHHPVRTLARRRLDRGALLSVPELAALAHLPLDPSVPGLNRAGARPVPPPPSIPRSGFNAKVLGDADAGPHRPVALPVPDARLHTHVPGATGAGKTTLLAQLVCADAAAGRASVVIDPNGVLGDRILATLPANAQDRLVRIDPAASEPVAINPLLSGDPDVAVDNLCGICARIWPANWGPRTDDILRASALTLAHQPRPGGLADIPRLLTDPGYRRRAVSHVNDPILREFWTWYQNQSAAARAQATAPLLNKLRAVLLRPFARGLLSPRRQALDFGWHLDHGGVVIVRIPKGTLGTDTTRLIGSLIVGQIWQATIARSRIPEHARRDAACYIDEFHEFLNLPYGIDDMLAEARGYRLALTLAHQDLDQVPHPLRAAISANARNKIIFACSPEDARVLERHTLPNLRAHDLAHLDAYQAAARLLIKSATTPAFTFRTRPLPTDAPTIPD